jgi:hypothetical protein
MKRKAHSHQAKLEGLQEMARSRAAEQATLIAPEQLADAVDRFIEWEAFTLWVRAVVASEGRIPAFLNTILRARCPDFLENRESMSTDSLWADLLNWIEAHVFREATCEGWLDAVTYNARRRPQSQAAWRMWEEKEREWRTTRPSEYPSFDAWLAYVRAQ